MIKKGQFIIALVSLLTGLTLGSCIKEEDDSTNYPERIVFGLFTDPINCGGGEGCVEIFEMKSGALNEDVTDAYPQAGIAYNGNYSNELSMARYRDIESFFKSNPVPASLYDYPNGDIGTIQNWAWNVYFEIEKDGTTRYWRMDGSLTTLPSELQGFRQDIINAVSIASQF